MGTPFFGKQLSMKRIRPLFRAMLYIQLTEGLFQGILVPQNPL